MVFASTLPGGIVTFWKRCTLCIMYFYRNICQRRDWKDVLQFRVQCTSFQTGSLQFLHY